jgi:dephospho-CoA kinase
MSFTIGLTGGIGSGKTTIARLFQKLDINIIDADEIVKDLITNDQEIIELIIQHFGPDFVNTDGSLNRKALRERIFSNPDDKTYLEQLLHPRVRQQLIQAKNHFTSPYGLLVIPLLIEARMQDLVDRILVVHVPKPVQIERIMRRDHITQTQAEQAISNQISANVRLQHADDVIDNTANEDDLRHTIEQLHQNYLKLAQAQ